MQATADIPTGTLEEGPIGFTKPWKCVFHPGTLTELPLSLSTGVDILIEDEKRIVMMLNRDGLHNYGGNGMRSDIVRLIIYNYNGESIDLLNFIR